MNLLPFSFPYTGFDCTMGLSITLYVIMFICACLAMFGTSKVKIKAGKAHPNN
jgi:hypothetical protein